MVDVRVIDGSVEILVTDRDAFLLTRSRQPWKVTVPLRHVSRAVPGRKRGLSEQHHVLDKRGGLLICARYRKPTIDIYLDGRDEFRFMVLSVADPQDTADTIKAALRRSGR